MFWNALGGAAWAASIGLLAYFLGPTVERLVKTAGLVGTAIVVLLLAGLLLARRLHRRRTVTDQ